MAFVSVISATLFPSRPEETPHEVARDPAGNPVVEPDISQTTRVGEVGDHRNKGFLSSQT